MKSIAQLVECMRLPSVLAALILITGCSADSGSSEVAEGLSEADRAAILMYLQVRGMDVTTVEFFDDKLRVEDDMVFSVADLLKQSKESVDKGFLLSSLTPDVQRHLSLRFDSTVSTAWQSAFNFGAQQWSNAAWGGQNVSINIAGGGAWVIDVKSQAFTLNTCVFAEADFPSSLGTPGDVRINPIYDPSCCAAGLERVGIFV